MRDNNRVKERFELALDARQVAVIVVGSLVIVAGAFVLGVTAGRGRAAPAPAVIAAPKDPLARLDDPLPVPVREEPPPELKAHQALTDGRAIDQALPVAPARPALAVAPAPTPTPTPTPVVAAVTSEPAPQSAEVAWTRPSTEPAKPAVPAAKPAAAPKTTATPRTLARTTPPPRPVEAAPARKGAFTIQVGSSPHRAEAERLAKKLAARGPRVVVADVPGKGRWYRVQIGSFETQEAARRQLAALSREGVHGLVTASR